MSRLTVAAVGLLVYAIFCFICVRTQAPAIERDLLTRSRKALAANQVPESAVSMDGRDATLRALAGTVAVSGQARILVGGVDGVRVIRTVIESPPPPPPAKQVQQNLDTLLAERIVEFTPSSAELTDKGRTLLDEVAPMLASVPAVPCAIEGHTDSTGAEPDNLDLSRRRAEATKAYLAGKGISADRLSTAGFGSSRPVGPNDTREGRQRNRRIEFKLQGKN